MAAADLDHVALMRRTIAESLKAREAGVHPFAAILVGPDGAVLMTQHNAYMPDHDMTGHAERVLMTRASTSLPMDLPCRTVFDAGQRRVEVIGPLLEDEAAQVHEGVWR